MSSCCMSGLQGGLRLDSDKPHQAAKVPPAAASWQQCMLRPYNAVAAQLQEIFSGGLLQTTLLLQFIWFTNALAYYGLVLLTTSVSLCSFCCYNGVRCMAAVSCLVGLSSSLLLATLVSAVGVSWRLNSCCTRISTGSLATVLLLLLLLLLRQVNGPS